MENLLIHLNIVSIKHEELPWCINGKDIYLGEYNSPNSHLKYAQLIAEWRNTYRETATNTKLISIVTIGELALR